MITVLMLMMIMIIMLIMIILVIMFPCRLAYMLCTVCYECH